MAFLTEVEKSILKSYGNTKGFEWPRQYEAKREILEISQYTTSNYTTEPYQ
jgi:hypothetical protein